MIQQHTIQSNSQVTNLLSQVPCKSDGKIPEDLNQLWPGLFFRLQDLGSDPVTESVEGSHGLPNRALPVRPSVGELGFTWSFGVVGWLLVGWLVGWLSTVNFYP